MNALDFTGKTREQLGKTLEHKRRSDLLDLIFSLANFEPQISVRTFASTRQLPVETVRRLIRDRKLGAHLPAGNHYRISRSQAEDFDRRTLVSSNGHSPSG